MTNRSDPARNPPARRRPSVAAVVWGVLLAALAYCLAGEDTAAPPASGPATEPASRRAAFVKPSAEEALAFLRTLPLTWGGKDANGNVKWVQAWEGRTVQDIKTMQTLHPGYHIRSGVMWRRGEPVGPERKALPKFVGRMHTRLDPSDYRYFTAFEKLEKFEVSHDLEYLTDECMYYLGQLPQSVHTLRLEMCEATGEGVKHFQNLKGLKTLTMNLSRTLTDTALVNAAGIESLEHLEVSSCPAITGSGVSALAKLKDLKSLKIGSCSLSDAGLANFKALTIEELDLSHTEMGWAIEYRGGGRADFTVTYAGLRALLVDPKNLPNLKRLIVTTDAKIRPDLLTPTTLRLSREQKDELSRVRPGVTVR